MDSLPISIPAAPAPPGRTSLPILAALVPVAAGVVLWLVTGSVLSLCFAALGPLMLGAAAVDGRRSRRSVRRRAQAEEEQGWLRAEEELRDRHDAERNLRRHRDPDVLAALTEPPLREGLRPDAGTSIVVGSGTLRSTVRAVGGDGDRARAFQSRCGRIEGVPVTTSLGRGIALRGTPVLVEAAARALALQLCLRFSPSHLVLVGEAVERLGLAGAPHARASGAGAFRLALLGHGGAAEPVADAVLWLLPPGEGVPDGIVCAVDLEEVQRAMLRTPEGVLDVAPEFLSRAQAAAVAREIESEGTHAVSTIPDRVLLAELEQTATASSLVATIGRDAGEDVVVDLVVDGPHAIVAGTTGSGKSELLVSWVTALASVYGPDRVAFVLADFKGGTAFEPLRALPHVVAVITDLDPAGARRGVSSLTAEMRRREALLAEAGARDVAEVDMARLVIVVDEFAVLLQEHPDLANVFTDVAARGRALGMHLVLGTQRAVGVVRDALAANCPLRVSLRVGDPADSRAVIGSDGAAQITGGPESRGLALVRRPRDSEARMLRVALTESGDIARVAERWSSASVLPNPWLPPLPDLVPIEELVDATSSGALVLGLADDPDRQAQPLELLHVGRDRGLALIGQSGSGRTSGLRLIAAQCENAVHVPADLESAWDVVCDLASDAGSTRRGGAILCDDIDALLDSLPPEHAAHFAQLWERIVRARTDATIVLTARRANGAAGRILDLLPRRALLRMSGRTEHLAAGGEADGFLRDRPPGRARIEDREVQLAWVPERPPRATRRGRRSVTPSWRPESSVTGLVTAGAVQAVADLAAAFPECSVGTPEEVRAASDAQPTIIVADADTWQREWTLWQRIRAHGEILVRAESPTDLRQLGGVRELPPYARLHAGRAWAVTAVSPPRRVVIDVWAS